MKTLVFCLVVLTCTSLLHAASNRRVCYYTNWAQYRNGIGKFFPSNYETGLCTHIIYAFANVLEDFDGFYLHPYEWNDLQLGYPGVNSWKHNDPQLKTLLAIGGWNFGSATFTRLVSDITDMEAFAVRSAEYLQLHEFDGLDLDWEYPGDRGSPAEDKQRFTLFCQVLKKEYSKRGLLLTAAVAAGPSTVENAYEIYAISQELDFINLMSYDLYGSWGASTGHHTNMNPSNPLNVASSVEIWLQSKMDPDKLVLGLAPYGRTFTLSDDCNNGVGAPFIAPGTPGPYTGESGFRAYYEICNSAWTSRVCTGSSEARAPYGVANGVWVGFDDEESVTYKVLKIVKEKGLGGVMFWALDLDDFTGSCGGEKYPIIKTASRALIDGTAPVFSQVCQDMSDCDGIKTTTTTTTTSTNTTPTESSTTPTTTSTSTTATSTSSTPTTTSTSTTQQPSGACEMPPLGERKECWLNTKGSWGTIQAIDEWCATNCLVDPTCNKDMCCCKGSTTPLTTTTTTSTTSTITSTTPTKTSTTSTTTSSTPTTTSSTPTTTSTTNTPTTTTTKIPPNKCFLSPYGNRKNCKANPNGIFFMFQETDQFCRASCETDPKCCEQLCCCDERDVTSSATESTTTTTTETPSTTTTKSPITTTITTSTTPTTTQPSTTTSSTTTTTEEPSGACEMPDVLERTECWLNTEGLYGSSSGMNDWCMNTCILDPSCPTTHCCCK